MPELKDLRCSVCGCVGKDFNRMEITGCGKVMCQSCERACKNYRAYMLPNGTHCMAAFEAEYFKYRLIAMNIPAQPSAVKRARKKYEDILFGELFEQLAKSTREYKNITDEKARALARTQLEAMRQILYERIQKHSIDRHLFEIINSLTELKKSEAV